jgi:sugar phosphate isomerase/epimerase
MTSTSSNHPLSRRRLLAAAALGAGSALLPNILVAATKQPFFERLNLPIGLELYIVQKEIAADLDGTLAQIAKIGYKTVEISSFYGHTPAKLRAAFDRHGLICRSMHAQGQPARSGDASFTEFPKLIDAAKTLGVQYVVLPMPALHIDLQSNSLTMEGFMAAVTALNADDWKACAAMLNEQGAKLAKEKLKIAYHNHNIEFKPIGDTTPYEMLIANTDPSVVTFELDVGWVASAGLDPLDLLRRHHGRFELMHVKDLKSSTKPNFTIQTDPAELGAGTLDWKKLAPLAYQAGVRNFIVEQEPPYPAGPISAAEHSYHFLSQLVTA